MRDVRTEAQESNEGIKSTTSDKGFERTALRPFSHKDQLRFRSPGDDQFQGPNRRSVILEIVKPRDLEDHQFVLPHPDFTADCVAPSLAIRESFHVNAIVYHADTACGQSFVGNQGLPYRLADAYDTVTAFEHQPVGDDSLSSGKVGLVTPVLGEEYGGPMTEPTRQKSIEKRRVLVSVDEVRPLSAELRAEANCTL
jgi:hypothetical protein